MFVTCQFRFDSAHYLTRYYGKCERVHGHTYRLEVTVDGTVQENGMVVDFVLLKRVIKKYVIAKLDHQLLNDVLENPSAERVIVWIWDKLSDITQLLIDEKKDLSFEQEVAVYLKQERNKDLDFGRVASLFDPSLRLYEVRLWETDNNFVTYRGI